MKLAVISMKACREVRTGGAVYAGGGFPVQMHWIGDLFDETVVCVPCELTGSVEGMTAIQGRGMRIQKLTPLGGSGISRKLKFPFWLARNLVRLVTVLRSCDVVHCPLPGDVPLLGLILARGLRRRLFVRYCGSWPPSGSPVRRLCGRLMEAWASPGHLFLATGEGSYPPSHRNPEIGWIFASTVREERLSAAVPRRCPVGGGKLVFCGRLEASKGISVVLEAMAQLIRGGTSVTLDLVGDGAARRELEAQVVSLGVSEAVTFHGRVASEKVWSILRACDLFVFPSSGEGFPKAVLEALACGLPIVASRLPVLEAMVGDSCGHLVNSGSSAEYTCAIRACLEDTARYEAFSRTAIAVARRYSVEHWQAELRRRMEFRFGRLRSAEERHR